MGRKPITYKKTFNTMGLKPITYKKMGYIIFLYFW